MVAPQLKNLTVEYWQGLHLISAPELVSLLFKGLLLSESVISLYGVSYVVAIVVILRINLNLTGPFSTNGTNLISTFSVC
ncbi:hypothetical protein Tco_1297770 [Tanacetum coccineum]